MLYNRRLYEGTRALVALLHNARAYAVPDDERDMTFDDFIERYRVALAEDVMDVDNAPVDLSALVYVLSQFPAYNDLNVLVRAIVGRVGCNAETRRKINGWVQRASDGVTRLIVFLVPTYADFLAYDVHKQCSGRSSSTEPPRIDKRLHAYLRGIQERAGITVELLHLTDVEHMHRMHGLYASMPWRNGVVESPCMSEKIGLLTADPYADQAEVGDDLASALSYEEARLRTQNLPARPGLCPRVKISDWIPRIFGARQGDVIRYKGGSETAGIRSVWRRVV